MKIDDMFTVRRLEFTVWIAGLLLIVAILLPAELYAQCEVEGILAEADTLLDVQPLSVMMKQKTPASGDKHDYMSQARYAWPNTETSDGLPYVMRDGVTNPEIHQLDRDRLGLTARRITTLSCAWHASGEERYAEKATELIRTWFLDKATRMNPHLEYAQMIPGQNGDKGRCYGLIDTYSFIDMLDGVRLLEGSKSFTSKDKRQLKEWFAELTKWMQESG